MQTIQRSARFFSHLFIIFVLSHCQNALNIEKPLPLVRASNGVDYSPECLKELGESRMEECVVDFGHAEENNAKGFWDYGGGYNWRNSSWGKPYYNHYRNHGSFSYYNPWNFGSSSFCSYIGWNSGCGESFGFSGSIDVQGQCNSACLYQPYGPGCGTSCIAQFRPSRTPKTDSRTVYVRFYNGRNISIFSQPIPLPHNCSRPVIVTQAVTNSIACSDANNAQIKGVCPANPGSTSQMMSAAYTNLELNRGTYQVFLEATNGVCVGIHSNQGAGTPCLAASPFYGVNVQVTCN